MRSQMPHNMSIEVKPSDDYCDNYLSDDSIESLEDLLPKIHQKQSSSIALEERIKQYLKQLQIVFKTDPRKKEFEYFEKQQKTIPQFLGSVEGSPCLQQIKQKSKYCSNKLLSRKYI